MYVSPLLLMAATALYSLGGGGVLVLLLQVPPKATDKRGCMLEHFEILTKRP